MKTLRTIAWIVLIVIVAVLLYTTTAVDRKVAPKTTIAPTPVITPIYPCDLKTDKCV